MREDPAVDPHAAHNRPESPTAAMPPGRIIDLDDHAVRGRQ